MKNLSINFHLFGIPVEIQPFSWLLLAFLGGALNIGGGTTLSAVLAFMLMGMLCLLCHEFGHALVGRRYGGGYPYIVIGTLGGMAVNQGARLSRWDHFKMVLAGPVGSFLPLLLAALILGIQIGNVGDGFMVAFTSHLPFSGAIVHADSIAQANQTLFSAIEDGSLSQFALYFYDSIFFIGIWWTFLNLLPIYPLDGSHLLNDITQRPILTAWLGVLISVTVALYFLSLGSIYNMFLLGYLGYINWQYLQKIRGGY